MSFGRCRLRWSLRRCPPRCPSQAVCGRQKPPSLPTPTQLQLTTGRAGFSEVNVSSCFLLTDEQREPKKKKKRNLVTLKKHVHEHSSQVNIELSKFVTFTKKRVFFPILLFLWVKIKSISVKLSMPKFFFNFPFIAVHTISCTAVARRTF